MKRTVVLIGLGLFSWGTYTGISQFNAIVKNIEYFSENAPNIKEGDDEKAKEIIKLQFEETARKINRGDLVKKKRGQTRTEKSPEAIFEEADYLVKIRIFKKMVIPATNQEIYIETGGFGSGFITDDRTLCRKSAYCVVTAFHVVDDETLTYFAESKDGSQAQLMELANGSTTYDFAVLRFVDFDHVPKKTAVLGESSALKPGTRIHTMGSNSFGDFWFSPDGHLYTDPKRANPVLREKFKKIQMDHPEVLLFHTPVFHGFSGGPLINKYGEVVGIAIGVSGLDAEPIYIGSPIDGIRKTMKKMK